MTLDLDQSTVAACYAALLTLDRQYRNTPDRQNRARPHLEAFVRACQVAGFEIGVSESAMTREGRPYGH